MQPSMWQHGGMGIVFCTCSGSNNAALRSSGSVSPEIGYQLIILAIARSAARSVTGLRLAVDRPSSLLHLHGYWLCNRWLLWLSSLEVFVQATTCAPQPVSTALPAAS